MPDKPAIMVSGLHKDFVLPHERQSSVKAVLMRQRDARSELQHVLRDVSFEIEKGEFFGIVGRNGSGKSTLLKILAGIYQPTSGAVHHEGWVMPLIELGVGFNHELTGRENVYMNGAMIGFPRRKVDELYDDIVEFAGLERFMDQKLKNYSSGMQVRLAFSIATRAQADILLLDEVLAVGDAEFQRKCLDYFHEIKRSGTTVVLVTHSMSNVREFCDRAILIEEGQIVAAGSPEDVANAYTQLFYPSADYTEEGEVTRFGSGDLRFEDVRVAPELTELDDEISIGATIVPQGTFRGRVRLGLLVQDSDGKHLFGTDAVAGAAARVFEHDIAEPTKFRWRVPNLLGAGEYEVTLIAYDVDSHAVIEQADGIASFSVRRDPHTANVLAPPFRLELEPD